MRCAVKYCIRFENEYKWREEGIYKTKFVANRHLRKLRRKYPGTEFKVKELLGS